MTDDDIGLGKQLMEMAYQALIVVPVALVGWEIGQLFGGMDALVSRIIYILVGLSALYEVVTHWGRCKECSSSM